MPEAPITRYQFFRDADGDLGRRSLPRGRTEIMQPDGTWYPYEVSPHEWTSIGNEDVQRLAGTCDLYAPAATLTQEEVATWAAQLKSDPTHAAKRSPCEFFRYDSDVGRIRHGDGRTEVLDDGGDWHRFAVMPDQRSTISVAIAQDLAGARDLYGPTEQAPADGPA
jgi:hypothetical protein